MEFFLFLLGAAFSWLLSHIYYRRSSKQAPEWAEPLIAKLPDAPVSPSRLLKLYREALKSGEMEYNEFHVHEDCPNCGASPGIFEPYEYIFPNGDGQRGRRCIKCKHEVTAD